MYRSRKRIESSARHYRLSLEWRPEIGSVSKRRLDWREHQTWLSKRPEPAWWALMKSKAFQFDNGMCSKNCTVQRQTFRTVTNA